MSLHDVMEAWAARRIDAATAIRLGRFRDFGELLGTTLDHGIKIDFRPLPHEHQQALRAVEAIRQAGFVPPEEVRAR